MPENYLYGLETGDYGSTCSKLIKDDQDHNTKSTDSKKENTVYKIDRSKFQRYILQNLRLLLSQT